MTTREKAERLHKKVRTFVITCNAGDGYPLTKAVVAARHRESLSEIYFCTNTQSKFAAEAKNNPKGNVYFYSKGIPWKGCYLKGAFGVETDMAVKERFWQSKYKNAYPTDKNFTDPDFCLLKFTPISGRFYCWYKTEDFEI